MKDTLTIEVTDHKVYKLLQDLEDLSLIRMLKSSVIEDNQVKETQTSKFRGALRLTEDEYKDFQNHAKTIRNEWKENI